MIGIALIGLAAVYAGIIGGFAVGLRRVLRAGSEGGPMDALPFVSVIVPARDEEGCIARCLDSILVGDYPKDRFEVIVVDDLSEDRTAAVVRAVMQRVNARVPVLADGTAEAEPALERVRLFQMPENLDRARAHKKRAITKGIAHARGEVILTTDADCALPSGWIRAMVGSFDAGTALVSGPALYPVGETAASRVQALEFLGLNAVGAGAIGAGRPNLANGANIAYRKDVFDALGGFDGIDHLTSGDDELLMQKIAYGTGWRVRFCADPRAAVLTDAAPTVRAFFDQRRRWASKGAHYPHPPLQATVVAIFVFYVALLVGTLGLPLWPALAPAVLVAWALKIAAEASLLGPMCRHYGRGRLMAYFLPAQLLHVPYIVGVAVAGAVGNYTWKGRRVRR